MKFFLTSLIIIAVGVTAVPDPKVTACPEVCHLVKPVCPPGQAPTGSNGCWGCCQPIPCSATTTVTVTVTEPTASPTTTPRRFCPAVCRTQKPVCPSGEAPSGSPGCWGCCQPISVLPKPTQRPCLAFCRTEKPVCPEGEAPTGSEDCWGCCQPIGSF